MFLCYKEPAHMSYYGWENEALPLGNGKIGAKVFGGVDCELIHFNEKTLWSGGKDIDGFCYGIKNADNGKTLREIQAQLDKGNTKSATDKMKGLEGDMTGFGAYQSFGNLYLKFPKAKNEKEKYTRDLELDTASSMVSYHLDGLSYTRHYFLSYPDNVFVGRIKSEALPVKEGETPPEAKINLEAYFISDQKALSKASGGTITTEGTVMANIGTDAKAGKDKNSMKFAGAFKFITDGEMTETSDGRIIIKNAESVTVIASLATNYINSFPEYFSEEEPLDKALKCVNSAAEMSFGELYRRHLADYKALYDRVKFTLGESDAILTTDYMLSRFEKKGENKRNLITLLFQYARYLLIASSRDGSLPANLQGIWNAKNNPAWCCDYHFNVNVQMNYWGAYAANLAETALPYIDFVNSLKKPGRLVANKTLGIGQNKADGSADLDKETGFMFHTMVTPLGFVGPGSDWKWGWAPTNGAWALQGMYDYYLYTGDTEKLKNDIYPTLQECALMWTQLLTHDKKSGRLVCSPGFSPEHGPVAAGNTYDQCIIYNLYEDLLCAAEYMKEAGYESSINESLIETVKQQITLLKPLHVGKWGQIKEWYDEDKFFMRGYYNQGVQKKHRHISHLLSLYPFRQISPDDKQLSAAALTTLKDRGNKSTGWGLAIRLLSYARLLKGNECDEIIAEIMKTAILKNLFGTHPPFQIDGNFGLLAGICEMLLQSHENHIRILPALPDSWHEGEINGLMARGNFEFSLKWKGDKLKEGSVKSNLGGKCSLRYDGKIMLIYDEDGSEVETEFADGITTFMSEKGKTYKFS
ncbi:MAG: glycoside hydrolase family 95 protein [Clostridia bacterium]|nr:glycoside hydrolase family 95 protein [Clostridia bacterium]